MKSIILLSIVIISLSNCSSRNENNLRGDDIRLFKGVIWNLAKAVEKEDTLKIERILRKSRIDIDIREPKFGKTLLIWSVSQNKFHSMKMLLKYGANPNLHDKREGLSAIIAAADKEETSKYLKEILRYGGDVNNYVDSSLVAYRPSPLIAASRRRLESVKLLLENGAFVNYSSSNGLSALYVSVIAEKPEIVYYLLSQSEIEYSKPLVTTIDGKELFITNMLRAWMFKLNTEKYKVKMKIVEFLKKNEMDYWTTEIPSIYYNNHSREYLEKY